MTEPQPHGANIRLYPEVAARVRAWAEREKRSVNSAANLLIERALDAEEK
jgi:hypothetical protein